jgi:coatomer subunit beta
MATDQPCYTLIASPSDTGEIPNEQEFKKQLSEGDVKGKTASLKKIIQLMLNGERFPGLLMTIIQYVMPSQDHTLKKLLLIFWEIVPKTTPDGKLLHEMILVCDAYRKDLQHPNEFIRGSTLRFLCKLKEPELLEPLMPAIRACLENRHAYVRRNAVLAIFTIYKNFDQLIPDAPELVQGYLEGESDPSCKRNAFMMLMHVDQDRALDYLSSCIDLVHTFNEILQLVIVELVYKVCYDNPAQRSRFIRCVYNMLNSTSNAVRYDAAGVLVTLSSAPTAVKAAAQCYIELIVKESDNNIKLIVFDRLFALKNNPAHEKILQDLVMELLRVLSSTDLEVRKKALKLVSELVTSRTVDEVILIMKKELANTESASDSETVDISGYRQLLVQTLHQCSIRFPSVAPTVVPVLTDFLSDKDKAAAFDILTFTRDAVQRYPSLQTLVVNKLLEVFSIIQVPEVHRGALWILGEYATSVEDISRVLQVIRKAIGEIPIVDSELRKAAGENPEEKDLDRPTTTHTVRVTADGTYASESALVPTIVKKDEDVPPIRRYLLEGKFFIGAAVSSTLTKLALRYLMLTGDDQSKNMFCAEVMLMIASILHLGRSGLPKEAITNDDYERMSLCVRSLAERQPAMTKAFAEGSREALITMLKTTGTGVVKEEKKSKEFAVQPDDLINFRQLTVGADSQGENKIETSLLQATGNIPTLKEDVSDSKLSKVS